MWKYVLEKINPPKYAIYVVSDFPSIAIGWNEQFAASVHENGHF
jgi:hypothetical protein